MKPDKDRLLELSEMIVDISDQIDELEFKEDATLEKKLQDQLAKIGDELVGYLETVDKKSEEEAYIYFALGSVCSLTGFYEKAEESYDNALNHWPDHVGLLNEAFDNAVVLKKFDKAREMIERSIKFGGETPDVLYNYASLVSHIGNITEARIILINALAKFPGDKGCQALLMELDIIVDENKEKEN